MTENFVDMKRILNSLKKIYQKQIEAKNLKLILNCHVPEKIKIHGDYRRIYAVLLELVSNAVKFTHKGSITISAEVDGKKNQHQLLKIAVSDTGIGISKKRQKIIFDEFNFGSASPIYKNMDASTGWGLVIVRKLVSEMGGMINIKSPLRKKGTDFICMIGISSDIR